MRAFFILKGRLGTSIHDPGITMMEMICYALTDLDVRDAYPQSEKMCMLLKEISHQAARRRIDR